MGNGHLSHVPRRRRQIAAPYPPAMSTWTMCYARTGEMLYCHDLPTLLQRLALAVADNPTEPVTVTFATSAHLDHSEDLLGPEG